MDHRGAEHRRDGADGRPDLRRPGRRQPRSHPSSLAGLAPTDGDYAATAKPGGPSRDPSGAFVYRNGEKNDPAQILKQAVPDRVVIEGCSSRGIGHAPIRAEKLAGRMRYGVPRHQAHRLADHHVPGRLPLDPSDQRIYGGTA